MQRYVEPGNFWNFMVIHEFYFIAIYVWDLYRRDQLGKCTELIL